MKLGTTFGRFTALAAAGTLLLAACAPAAAPSQPVAQATTAPKPAATAAAPAAPAATSAPAAAAQGAVKRGGTVRIGISQEPIVINRLLNAQTVNSVVGEVVTEGMIRPLARTGV